VSNPVNSTKYLWTAAFEAHAQVAKPCSEGDQQMLPLPNAKLKITPSVKSFKFTSKNRAFFSRHKRWNNSSGIRSMSFRMLNWMILQVPDSDV
jgi:hypothetical protein